MERKVRDSCGSSGTGETPQAKPRRLSARPAESEHPVVEISPLFNNNTYLVSQPKLHGELKYSKTLLEFTKYPYMSNNKLETDYGLPDWVSK
ncbi:hypothetical protein CUU66_03680 [Peribacillus deserti]|uniref:Uncharacterized protein n=1 Tax=Peribacillus deserti TaxID=673318 RepID=A0A2N5MAD0_9BACI|nr:hypothetical protein CUU66_03680 [Peribacillus deserti]